MRCSNVVAVVAISLAAASAHAQTRQIDVIAASGFPAPGLDGVTLEAVTGVTMSPVTNGPGNVFFRTALRGDSVTFGTDDQAVWFWDSSTGLALVARSGSQAVDVAAGIVYWFFDVTGLTDQNEAVFRSRLTGAATDANNYGAWSWTPAGGLAVVVHEGAAAPGDPASTIVDVAESSPPKVFPRANRAGHMAFLAEIQDTDGTTQAVFAKTDTAAIGPVIASGAIAPGGAADDVYLGTDYLPAISATGKVAFRATVAGNDGAGTPRGAIFGPDATGALMMLAEDGTEPPGVTGGTYDRLRTDGAATLSDDGLVTFRSSFWDGPTFGTGIWQTNSSGEVVPQVLSGQVAPGFTDEGYTMGSFRGLVGNASGQFAFQADVDVEGTAREMNFGPDGSGGLVPIAEERGAPAADTDGATFNALNTTLLMNAAGQVAYIGKLVPLAPVTSNNDTGVWLYTPGEGSRLLLREGDEIEVAPGDTRTVMTIFLPASGLEGSGGSDGRPRGLADDGSLVVMVTFWGAGPTPSTNHQGVLRVRLVDSAAPVTAADSYGIANDRAVTIDAPGVLANDSDPEGSPLSAAVVAEPANGTLTLNADGSFTYTADTDFVGEDSFIYEACDEDAMCSPATVTLDVFAVDACMDVTCDSTGCVGTPIDACDAGPMGDPDAGSAGDPDAGSAGDPDAGSPGDPDAGSPGDPDAGSPGSPDAGSPGSPDAGGTGGTDDTDGGCECRTARADDLSGAALLLLITGLFVVGRRRRGAIEK